MGKVKNDPAEKDKTAPVEQPQEIVLAERIKSQVLAKIGTPARLDRVEICRHHGNKYRINIWQQPIADKSIAVTFAPRIGLSYYLTVSDTGEILQSSPPLTSVPQWGRP